MTIRKRYIRFGVAGLATKEETFVLNMETSPDTGACRRFDPPFRLEPGKDIEIKFTGIRTRKLREDLGTKGDFGTDTSPGHFQIGTRRSDG